MAGEIEHIKGKGFDANPQNINKKGRPRKLISDVIVKLEADGYKETTKTEVTGVYLRLINIDKDELIEMSIDTKQPILVQIIASALLEDKGFEIIDKMLDRSIGRSTQPTENTHTISGDLEQLLQNYNKLNDNK